MTTTLTPETKAKRRTDYEIIEARAKIRADLKSDKISPHEAYLAFRAEGFNSTSARAIVRSIEVKND